MSACQSRRLSTKPSPNPPTQVRRAPEFPKDTIIYATAPDGQPVSFVMGPLFLKRYTRGQPLPPVQVLTGRDFRRVADLIAWRAPGTPLEIWAAPQDVAAVATVAGHYGDWDGKTLLPKN